MDQSLVHRKMFDEISDLCAARHLRHSVWVDDVTISGRFVPSDVLISVRDVVRRHGLKTHKIKYRSSNKPVFITGIGVVGENLIAPRKINGEIKELYRAHHEAQTSHEKEDCSQALLSRLGTVRHIVGRASLRGRKAADQINAIKQEMSEFRKLKRAALHDTGSNNPVDDSDSLPFNL